MDRESRENWINAQLLKRAKLIARQGDVTQTIYALDDMPDLPRPTWNRVMASAYLNRAERGEITAHQTTDLVIMELNMLDAINSRVIADCFLREAKLDDLEQMGGKI